MCRTCSRMSIAMFQHHENTAYDTEMLVGDLTVRLIHKTMGLRGAPEFIGQVPKVAGPNVPEHLPANVVRAYLEAEKAFAQGIWSLAAGGYRKAVDRAITPLLGEQAKGKMTLGPKIGLLEKTNLLPPAMIEWIKIVKDDGNFALHDDDQDFDAEQDVTPAREFAFTLLTYLYTLPEKVRLARGLPPEEIEDKAAG